MSNNNTIVQMHNVTKHFGKIKALDNINLEVHTGRIIGLVGANGSGKSTLLRHIIGLYLPCEGACTVFNCPSAELGPKQFARIGYVHQEGELIDWMTTKQLIKYVSTYYDNWNHELEKKYIDDFKISMKSRVGTLSPGQRQKLAILLAIGFEPELLILDEPASNLDPIARAQFLDLLLSIIQNQNKTIIISSHILSDIEKVIDYLWIMKEGKILRDCSFDDLREEFCRVKLTSLNGDIPADVQFERIVNYQCDGSNAVVTLQNFCKSSIDEKARKINCKVEIESLTLEEIYRIVAS